MSYDSPDFRVQFMYGPIVGSFATGLLGTTAIKYSTSVSTVDRVEFFRNVKLLGFKVLPKTVATTANAAAAHATLRYQLVNGSDMVATAAFVGTATEVGAMADGGIRAGTFANIGSNSELALRIAFTGDGTVETLTAGSVEAYVLFEHRFA